ncbi:MAG TPA: Na-translocating system protein MpsB, partial [Burkholderiales bacterium]|nr:Na-translocating system protein MpsB [Burkholderiales bacterium]
TLLGISGLSDRGVESDVRRRSRDWSEVRPEWALAGNAAFIAAPRFRTAGLDLEGRAFLHEYVWREDREFKILELIMTAPMVVGNWINMQYYGSVVDNQHFGSGNKVLHNIVGGAIGVLEGNGGDLRVGLPLQSLHDGRQWVHEPLRLSVFIEAPREAIEGIIGRHEIVRNLVNNGWIHLFQIDGSSGEISKWHLGYRWEMSGFEGRLSAFQGAA